MAFCRLRYTAWVDYLRTHVAHSRIVAPEETAETTESAASEAAASAPSAPAQSAA